jgi:hypothetical protein
MRVVEERGFFENRCGKRPYFATNGQRNARQMWLFCNPEFSCSITIA